MAVTFLSLAVIELRSNWPPPSTGPSLFSPSRLGFKSFASCSETRHAEILQCMPLMWFLKFQPKNERNPSVMEEKNNENT